MRVGCGFKKSLNDLSKAKWSTMKKGLLIIVLLIFTLLIYIVYQWRYIHGTDDVPYKDLGYFGKGGCMIYVNIKYNGVVYPLVGTNTMIAEVCQMKINWYVCTYILYT